jgi:rRNA-processing protein FCF1
MLATLFFDTNVLIDQLELMIFFLTYESVFLVKIPHAVVRELDGLKKSSDSRLARQARRASNEIYGLLINPKVKLEIQKEDDRKVGDDSILEYLISEANDINFQTFCILLTQDTNLALRCISKGFRSIKLNQKNDLEEEKQKIIEFLSNLDNYHIVDVEMGSPDTDEEEEEHMLVEMAGILKSIGSIYFALMAKILMRLGVKSPVELHDCFQALYDKYHAIDGFPPHHKREQLIGVISAAKDISKSLRNDACQFTKADLLKFIDSTKSLIHCLADRSGLKEERRVAFLKIKELSTTIESI